MGKVIKTASLVGKAKQLANEQAMEAYKKEWDEAVPYCNELLEKAIRLLQFEPAILTYFSLVRWSKTPKFQ